MDDKDKVLPLVDTHSYFGEAQRDADWERTKPLVHALRGIRLGAGPFSRDPLTHAENCLEAMKKEAQDALAQLGVE